MGVGNRAAYVFRRSARSYIQEAKLMAPDPEVGAEFGLDVAAKRNGAAMRHGLIAVGARREDIDSRENQGAVYLFQKHYNTKISKRSIR
jgi:hypothetical protein